MKDDDLDQRCLERLRARDPAALEELYDRHTPLLYPVILRILGRAADAEEVLQEAWLQVWRQAEHYDGTRGAVIAWLLTVARTRAIDRLRSAAARRRTEDRVEREADPVSAAPGPAADAERRQQSERVRAALEKLQPQHRQVLELAFFGGMSQSEIASQLSTPLGTVKSWMRQALLRLRDRLPEERVT